MLQADSVSMKSATNVVNPQKKADDNVRYARFVVGVSLFLTAVVCAGGAYWIVLSFQGNLKNSQYSSIKSRFTDSTVEKINRKVQALASVSALMSHQCPDVAIWPNCSTSTYQAYIDITEPLAALGELRAIGLIPKVTPQQITSFEAFAYNFYASQSNPLYRSLGISSFGKGISATNATTGKRYRDTTGVHGGYDLLFPIFQMQRLFENKPALMYNLHSESNRIGAIDDVINCFEISVNKSKCIAATDVIKLVQDTVFRPAILVIHPISPRDDPNTLVGICHGVMNWDTVFSNAMPSYVDGIDIILSGGSITYSFTTKQGNIIYVGSGDHHDTRYDSDGHTFALTELGDHIVYSVSIYPSKEYEAQFKTNLPLYAMFVAFGIVLLTSILFVAYDYLVNRRALESDLIMETKRLFVRFISHEIRTPMNIVHLGLTLLNHEISEHSKNAKDHDAAPILRNWMDLIDDIAMSSDAAILVLNDLINYDKLSMGMFQIEREKNTIIGVVSKVVRSFQVQARQAEVSIAYNCNSNGLRETFDGELYSLFGFIDPIKMEHVFRNLVSNAIKFTPQGGVVDISVVWNPSGLAEVVDPTWDELSFMRKGSFVVTVKDSGAGMSEIELQQLFSEGVQFRANQLQGGGGSGLGLWISKGVVKLHHGTLEASSAGIGKGSTFTCEIPVGIEPLHPLSPDEVEKGAISKDTTVTLPGTHHNDYVISKIESINTVLLADDSTISRRVVKRLLESYGYTCLEAFDGIDAISTYNAHLQNGGVIDVILMDFEMPRMNGPDATKALRDSGVAIPVIGLTGNVLADDVSHFISRGATAVLSKPLRLSDLHDILMKLFPSERPLSREKSKGDDVANQAEPVIPSAYCVAQTSLSNQTSKGPYKSSFLAETRLVQDSYSCDSAQTTL